MILLLCGLFFGGIIGVIIGSELKSPSYDVAFPSLRLPLVDGRRHLQFSTYIEEGERLPEYALVKVWGPEGDTLLAALNDAGVDYVQE